MHSEGDEDTLRLHDVAVEAILISVGCVARPPHYGGTVQIGPQAVTNVSIMGWPFPEATSLEIVVNHESVMVADFGHLRIAFSMIHQEQ